MRLESWEVHEMASISSHRPPPGRAGSLDTSARFQFRKGSTLWSCWDIEKATAVRIRKSEQVGSWTNS